MKTEIYQLIQEKSALLFQKVKHYREHLHRHPELSFEEYETMGFVCEILTKLGIPHQSGVGKTGVVATIRNASHAPNAPCVALRADLDALPIQEENDVTYRSVHSGKMHACGHDVHTAILLGVAEILHELNAHLPHPVKLLFQPGEEKNPGGATLLLSEGVLENPTVKEMFALHVYPELPAGKIGFREGIYMASSDEIHLTIHGKGGHGAMPHACVDPILIGANILVQLQQIVSRKCDPKIPSVLTFGHFEAIGSTNVIPSTAHLKGTFRTMNETWRAAALQLIEKTIHLLAESQGATVDLVISKGYPYLQNDPVVTSKTREKAQRYFGEENVEELPIRLTSEDFAFYSHLVPVCFFRLGVGNQEQGIVHGVHHPKFDIDPAALQTGMEMMALCVF